MSALGAFTTADARAGYHCGTIYVELPDASRTARLGLAFPYAAGVLGERSATITLVGPPRGDLLVQTTGSVTISAITEPLPDAGVDLSSGWGKIEGSFSVESSCLAISGSFVSPYCFYDSLCG